MLAELPCHPPKVLGKMPTREPRGLILPGAGAGWEEWCLWPAWGSGTAKLEGSKTPRSLRSHHKLVVQLSEE